MVGRYFFLAILLFCGCKSTDKMPTQGTIQVFIQLTTTSSYCGGAKPPVELQAELATPKPLPSVEIFVRRGDHNDVREAIVTSAISDDQGKLRFDLPPGKYCLVTKDKSDDKKFHELNSRYAQETEQWSAIDSVCLTEWLRTPDLAIEVSQSGGREYALNIHQPCIWKSVPCANYKGPYPP